jgi:hypothetical protein
MALRVQFNERFHAFCPSAATKRDAPTPVRWQGQARRRYGAQADLDAALQRLGVASASVPPFKQPPLRRLQPPARTADVQGSSRLDEGTRVPCCAAAQLSANASCTASQQRPHLLHLHGASIVEVVSRLRPMELGRSPRLSRQSPRRTGSVLDITRGRF